MANTLKKKYNEFLEADQLPPVDDNDSYIYAMTDEEFRGYSVVLSKNLLNLVRAQSEIIKELMGKVLELEAKVK